MEIDHDLQSSFLRPAQRLAQLIVGTLHIGIALSWQHTPVTNWDSHVVQTSTSHLEKVVLGEKAIPMLLEARLGSILAEQLSQRPLVFSSIAFENGGSNPWLEDEPTTSVDTTDFLAAVGE